MQALEALRKLRTEKAEVKEFRLRLDDLRVRKDAALG